MTKTYQQSKGCLRLAARYLCAEEQSNNKEISKQEEAGIRRKWTVIGDKLAKMVDADDDPFAIVEEIETAEDEEIIDDNLLDDIESDTLSPEERECVRIAKLSNGIFSAYGQHAAGVVISKDDISDVIPLMKSTKNERLQTQCTMAVAESKGLLKMDFLGLKNLDIITKVLRQCNDATLQDYEKRESVLNDPAIYRDIYCSGMTKGVFQFESPGMTKLLKDLQPDCFEDIIAAISLYRPGPMDFIPQYIEGKRHPEEVIYLSPQMEEILKSTYGTIVYQEQVMQIFQLAGYTLGGADAVRKAMSKKHEDEIEAERHPFIFGDESRGIEGIIKTNGISEADANALYDKMVEFGKYAFNKSHATAYAVVSLFTAYEKKYHPSHFYAETLNYLGGQKKKKMFTDYVDEMKHFGITLRNPSFLYSKDDFSVSEDGKEIYYGLGQIKGMSDLGTIFRTDCLQKFITKNPKISETALKVYAELGMFKTCFDGETTPYSRERMVKAISKVKPVIDKFSAIKKEAVENRSLHKNPPEGVTLEELDEKYAKILQKYNNVKNEMIHTFDDVRNMREPEFTEKRRMERYMTEKEYLYTIFSAKEDVEILKNHDSDFSHLYDIDAKEQRIAALVLSISAARRTKISNKTYYQVELMDKNGDVISRRFENPPQMTLGTFLIQPEEKRYFYCKEVAPLKQQTTTHQVPFSDVMQGIADGTIHPNQLVGAKDMNINGQNVGMVDILNESEPEYGGT